MKCLVTGGAGFIGSNLALYLEQHGHEVTVIDNLSSGFAGNLLGFHGDFHQLDISKSGNLDIFDDCSFEAVFHQASITDPRFPDDKMTLHQNVHGFENILNLANRHGAMLVYASTASLYGNGPSPQREDQPKHLLSAYAQSKLIMDEMASHHMHIGRVVGLRYFNVFGQGEQLKGRPASMVYHLIQQMKSGGAPRIFKMGEQVRDHVPVGDCIRANMLALEAPSGIYNVGTGLGTSFNDLVRMINIALGTDYAPEYIEMPYHPASYQANTQADLTRSKSLLGFVPTDDLQDAINQYAKMLLVT